jgi:hypothetical protein
VRHLAVSGDRCKCAATINLAGHRNCRFTLQGFAFDREIARKIGAVRPPAAASIGSRFCGGHHVAEQCGPKGDEMPRAGDDVRQAMKSSHSAEQWMLRSRVLALIAAGGRRSVAANVGPGAALHVGAASEW